jgi:hypothetical protein
MEMDLGLMCCDEMMTRVCRRKEKALGACDAHEDCRRRGGQLMAANLPQIYRSIYVSQTRFCNCFLDRCYGEGVEEIFSGDAWMTRKERSSEGVPGKC